MSDDTGSFEIRMQRTRNLRQGTETKAKDARLVTGILVAITALAVLTFVVAYATVPAGP